MVHAAVMSTSLRKRLIWTGAMEHADITKILVAYAAFTTKDPIFAESTCSFYETTALT